MGHHLFFLRTIGALSDELKLPGFYFGFGIQIFFLIFQIWHAYIFYYDLEILMDNLVSTMGVISGLFKITTLRLHRR